MMNHFTVNILPLCPDAERETQFQCCLQQMSEVTSMNRWNGYLKGFDVRIGNDYISFSGGKMNLKEYRIPIIHEDYPVEKSYREEWLKKFDLLILYCNLKDVNSYRSQIANIRNAMSLHNRSADVLLFLTNVDEAMDVVIQDSVKHTLWGIYSALTSMPYCTTRLKDSFEMNQLDSNYWEDQQISNYYIPQTHCRFQIPRGVICDCAYPLGYSGYVELIVDIINFALYRFKIRINKSINIHLININKNTDMELFDFFNQPKVVRLAVIGDTASGKTYFLQDLCTSLQRLGLQVRVQNHYPFSSINEFRADVHRNGCRMEKTKKYVCRQDNQYVDVYYDIDKKPLRLEFLDIPGDIFYNSKNNNSKDNEGMTLCIEVIRLLMDTKRELYQETRWENSLLKTLRYCGQNQSNAYGISNISATQGDNSHDATHSSVLKGDVQNNSPSNSSSKESDTVAGRSSNYDSYDACITKYKKQGKIKKQTKISGRKLLQHYFEYDPDTVYWALLDSISDLYQEHGKHLRWKQTEMEDYLKDFYFHVFLYASTDVVLCEKCLPSTDNSDINSMYRTVHALRDDFEHDTELNAELRKINLANKKQRHYYLAIKGADTYLAPNFYHEFFSEVTNRRDVNTNPLYSLFAFQMDKILGQDSGEISVGDIKISGQDSGEISVGDTKISGQDKSKESDDNKFVKNIIIASDTEEESVKSFLEKHKIKQKNYFTTHIKDVKNAVANYQQQFLTLVTGSNTGTNPLLKNVPKHVYYVGTPITDQFVIEEFKNEGNSMAVIVKKKESTADEQEQFGESNTPNFRACFGTIQLVQDILNAHDVSIKRDFSKYGEVLKYLQDV